MDFKDDGNENNEMFIANEMLPEPEEPLSSDCCGSGCSPCVFDIYERDLEIWRNECKNLVVVKESNVLCKETNGPSLSCTEYTLFELLSITKINDDAMIYRFMLPGQTSLNLHAGQHLLLRLMEPLFSFSFCIHKSVFLFTITSAHLNNLQCFLFYHISIPVRLYNTH